MKFSINKQKTIEIIGEYSNILKDNPVKPSLAGLFIQAKNNQVVFKGANTEIELIRYANCDIESEGQVLIKPALLLEYIKLIEEENINFEVIISDKISNFSLNKLEKIITLLAKKELKHIEVIGAILGGLIGVAQYLITLIIK